MKKIAIVTGATSGFGKSIANKFASEGYRVIITGRRKQLLYDLGKEIWERHQTETLPLAFDVRDRSEVDHHLGTLPDDWKYVTVLINNAGLALGRDYFDEADLEDWETMLDTNVKGVMYVTKAVLKYFDISGKGHIINIGSTAGKEVYEKGNIYCVSKHALDAMSQSMRIDLLRKGIRVTAIHPGAAETEFSMVRFKGDATTAKSVYEGFQPLRADDVADVAYYCASLPEHFCINDLVVTSTAQANSYYTFRK